MKALHDLKQTARKSCKNSMLNASGGSCQPLAMRGSVCRSKALLIERENGAGNPYEMSESDSDEVFRECRRHALRRSAIHAMCADASERAKS